MMVEAFIIALIMLILKGFKLKRIFKLRIVHIFIVATIITAILDGLFFNGLWESNKYIVNIVRLFPIILLSCLAVIYKDGLSQRELLIYMFVALTGIFLNNVVIWANNGCMPVRPVFNYDRNTFSSRQGYILADENTKLTLLGDVIDVRYNIFSVGDIFIIVFVAFIIYTIIKGAIMKKGVVE